MSVSKAKERRFCGESKKICLKKKKSITNNLSPLILELNVTENPLCCHTATSKKPKKTNWIRLKKKKSHLRRLPAPLPVLGIMGEPPHVPVGLDDLRPQDVILLVLPDGHRLQAAVELEGLRAQLQHCRTRRAKTRNEWVN